MEKHKCKLCLKDLPNGSAVGTHMKSNTLNLSVTILPKVQPSQLSDESEAASYSSQGEEEKDQLYGLRENPKRSIRLVDREFVDADSVVLQARESETESSKNPTRRRSKRTWKTLEQHEETKKLKVNTDQPSQTESWAEPEQVSSISDTTSDEDVAFCLMMLSRDRWKRNVRKDDDDVEEDEEETDESEEYFTTRAKYRCETCDRAFNSYQALGGHRASHKKIRAHETELAPANTGTRSMTEKKTHKCPVCFRVFSSGQAFGGHKRSHIVTGQVAAAAATQTRVKNSKKLLVNLIDLNLPAPVDEEEEEEDNGFLVLK